MSCNSESRRVINYSLHEPINNKYDLWLSENLRYNSEGSLIYDSPGQPACDLILKIYKDGDWKPIAGLSTEHIVANKINIVDGVNYTYISPNDNTLHINNGFQLNHLPLFRNPDDSPNELFDAGTLGEAIYGFVNEYEWTNIFEGDAFNNSFKLYFPTIIHNGDININDFIELANTERIGGIKAEQDPNTSDDCRNIPIVLAGPTVGSVWGLDFGTPGRRYLGDSDYNTEYLYLPGWALMEWMKNPYFNLQNPTPFISGWRGTSVRGRSDEEGLWVELDNIALALDGQIPSRKTTDGYTSIEWVDLPEIQTYTRLGNDSDDLHDYVVKGGGNDKQFLNGYGEWTVPESVAYNNGVGINIDDSNNINIDTSEATLGQVLSYDGSSVEWVNLPSLVEGNEFNTFIRLNKVYIGPYTCTIQANDFTLDTSVLIDVNGSYSNNHYPLTSFVDYLVEHQNGISRIKIESDNQVHLPYPSYMHFTTSATKCTFTFPKTMEFIETKSVNSLTGEDYYYTNTDYIIELQPATKYNVIFYKNCIKFETNSNSIFDRPFN